MFEKDSSDWEIDGNKRQSCSEHGDYEQNFRLWGLILLFSLIAGIICTILGEVFSDCSCISDYFSRQDFVIAEMLMIRRL